MFKSLRNAMNLTQQPAPSGQGRGLFGGRLSKAIRGAFGRKAQNQAAPQQPAPQPTMMADGGYVSGKRVQKSYGKGKK